MTDDSTRADYLEPPAPWTAADRRRLHDAQRRRGIVEPDGWIVRDRPAGADVAAGPRARDALRLARELGLSRRGGGDLFAWRATAAELDAALAGDLLADAMGIVPDGAPWWREHRPEAATRADLAAAAADLKADMLKVAIAIVFGTVSIHAALTWAIVRAVAS